MFHDHWVAVNTAKYGTVTFLSEQTILYRQHGSNVEGAISVGLGYFIQKVLNANSLINKFYNQARYFKEVTVFELLIYKFMENIQRMRK